MPPNATRPILIVDDEPAIRDSLRMIFEYEDVPVRTAASAKEAIECLHADPTIRIVFTDIKMPGIDGIELLNRIKTAYPAIVVVIVSGHGTTDTAIEALRYGAFDFLEKPLSTQTVFACLKRAQRHLDSERIIAHLSGTIFLSYASEDVEAVSMLAEHLSRAGYRPWLDKRNILPGQPWLPTIERAIRRSSFFIACLSRHSISKRGVLQREIAAALKVRADLQDSDIFLIPLKLEECKIPPKLRELQAIDYYRQDGWTMLLDAIRTGLEQRQI
jgi:FixJ family two-component response regulator